MITIYLNLDRAVNIHFVLFLPEDVISQYAKIDILSCTLISIGYIFGNIYLGRHLNTYMKNAYCIGCPCWERRCVTLSRAAVDQEGHPGCEFASWSRSEVRKDIHQLLPAEWRPEGKRLAWSSRGKPERRREYYQRISTPEKVTDTHIRLSAYETCSR